MRLVFVLADAQSHPLLQSQCQTLNFQKCDPHILKLLLHHHKNLLSSKSKCKALSAENLLVILISCDKEPHWQSYIYSVPPPIFSWDRALENKDWFPWDWVKCVGMWAQAGVSRRRSYNFTCRNSDWVCILQPLNCRIVESKETV